MHISDGRLMSVLGRVYVVKYTHIRKIKCTGTINKMIVYEIYLVDESEQRAEINLKYKKLKLH